VCSRFFAPWAGIPEDPVTGSAHSVLAAYYNEALGKNVMSARQCSTRGGEMMLKVSDDKKWVTVIGQTVTVISGTLMLPAHL
jgi:predicted PhzF superfamily epimerase YddE/YHI9